MKAVISIFILFSILSGAQGLDSVSEDQSYSLIEIKTPSKEVYDDGMYRKVYSAFYILNEMGEKVLSVGEVFDEPAEVKLKKGAYTFVYINSKGESSKQLINVDNSDRRTINFN